MASILFIMSHLSHQNATFGLARQLEAKGHCVTYAAPETGIDGESLAANVRRQGFPCQVLDLYQCRGRGRAAGQDAPARENFQHYLDNLAGGTLFRKLVKKTRPALILLDIHYPLFAVVLQSLGVPVVFVSTEILTDQDVFAPPLSSSLIPDGTDQSKAAIAGAWDGYLQARQLPPAFAAFLEGLADRYDFPLDRYLNTRRCTVPFGLDLPEVILWPAELDFPRTREKLRSKFYIGGLVDLDRREEEFDWSGIEENRPLVYCALGTRPSAAKTNFVKRLVRLFSSLPQYRFVVAAGPGLAPADREPPGANVTIVGTAPQIGVLKRARLMITHGGGNSLKECIRLGVPALCFPHDNDQFGNAARVEYHRIGLSGDMHRDDHGAIGEKMDRLLHQPCFRENLARFRHLFEEDEKSEKAVRVIESFIG